MNLTEEIRDYLLKLGASSVGFADISDITPIESFNTGIVFYINHQAENIDTVRQGPTYPYLYGHLKLNEDLDEIAIKGEKFLKNKGFKAYAQTTERIKNEVINNSSKLPHKTIATKAGLGWIGKSALFITNEYGPAVRLSSILTDAKLDYGIAIESSKCGECMICYDTCPGKAISGIPWNSNLSREDIYSHEKCEDTAKKLSLDVFGKEDTMCGICMNICPYTQKFIKKELKK